MSKEVFESIKKSDSFSQFFKVYHFNPRLVKGQISQTSKEENSFQLHFKKIEGSNKSFRVNVEQHRKMIIILRE